MGAHFFTWFVMMRVNLHSDNSRLPKISLLGELVVKQKQIVLFLVCRVFVTFINCSIFSLMVWALSNSPHTNKLNTRALSAFLFLLLEAGYTFNFRSHTSIRRHQNYRRRKIKLRFIFFITFNRVSAI